MDSLQVLFIERNIMHNNYPIHVHSFSQILNLNPLGSVPAIFKFIIMTDLIFLTMILNTLQVGHTNYNCSGQTCIPTIYNSYKWSPKLNIIQTQNSLHTITLNWFTDITDI